MTPRRLQKSIYWILQWGWRGPAMVGFAVFCLWLYPRLDVLNAPQKSGATLMMNQAFWTTDHFGGRSMTLGDMRKLGIRRLWISCLNRACQHDALLDVSTYPAGAQILSLRRYLKCDRCGGRNVDVRPYWKERAPRPRLTAA